MSLVRYRQQSPLFKMFFDDVFTKDSFFNQMEAKHQVPAANIKQEEDRFIIDLAAPGLQKDDFSINLENDLMTISAEKKVENEEKQPRFTRKEFQYHQFSRSFTLPESVNLEGISASYEQGVLSIVLPKNKEATIEPVRQIKVG